VYHKNTYFSSVFTKDVLDRDLGSIKPLETLGSSGDKKRYIIEAVALNE
jgi:hypothetical protein